MTTTYRFDFTLAAADADGVAQTQTPSGAGALTLDGALVTAGVGILGTGEIQRQVLITAAADDSGRTFTVTGTDSYGRTLTEDVTGPDTTTAATTESFQTVTSVTVDAATAGAITVGTNGVGASGIKVMNQYQTPFSASFAVVVTGTVNYTIQHTFDDPFAENPVYFNHPEVAAATASAFGSYDYPVTGVRVFLNSGAGSLRVAILQGE